MYEVQALLLPSVVVIFFICQMYLFGVFGWLVVFKRDALVFREEIECPVALRSTG